VIGEGVGAVILRRLEDAQAAGDRIYAVIRGIASNSDGKAEGPMTAAERGQRIALENAYQRRGVLAAHAGLPGRARHGDAGGGRHRDRRLPRRARRRHQHVRGRLGEGQHRAQA
jgi:hypothetical protein